MKKLLPLLLLALLDVTAVHADTKSPRADLVTRVESCRAILEELGPTIRPDVWQKARAVIIVNQFKAGFFFGVKAGYGVMLVKKSNGRWSLPVLLNATETSLGLQVGANALESIYIITDDQTPRLLFNRRFNVGVDAKAVAGPKIAEKETYNRPILETPVLVYTKATGLYAGATVKAGQLVANDDANYTLYNTGYTLPELLYSDWVAAPPEVQPLMNQVQRLAP